MVFFSCDGCGDMLKKAQVDPHVYKCKVGCHAVSCVDCSVSFPNDDYRAHTSCISEAERYEKTVYRGPKKGEQSKSKKLSPQESWNLLIVNAVETAPPSIKSQMELLTMLDNVPRKQKQFKNFTANSLKLRGQEPELMWKHLAQLKEEEMQKKKKAEEEQKPKEEAESDVDESDNKATDPSNSDKEKSLVDSKKIKKTMKKILKKAPQRKMKMKKLRQEVLAKLTLKKNVEKELKKAMSEQIGANPKKMKLDGKVVILLE